MNNDNSHKTIEKYNKVDNNKEVIVEKRRLKYNCISFIFDISSIILLIVMLVLALNAFNALPDRIGIHFDANGNIDGYGDKSMLFTLIYVSGAIYILCSIMHFIKIRWIINIGLPVYIDTLLNNTKHKDCMYKGFSIFVSLLNLCLIQLFFVLNYYTVIQKPLNMEWFILSIIIALGIPIVYLVLGLVIIFKMRKIERYSSNTEEDKNDNKR